MGESGKNSRPAAYFELGLSMSGAISAGAYTAGVFDFLFQALDEWEAARAAAPDTTPRRRVGIKVFSGASAGAITAAVGAIALSKPQTSKKFDTITPGMQQYKYCFETLYQTWVVQPCFVADQPNQRDFLMNDDLTPGPDGAPVSVTSLLNAKLLDTIADSALQSTEPVPPPTPRRAYMAQNFHIYLTLTNLRGIPYQVAFKGGNYGMMSHGDRAHYRIKGAGNWDTKSPFADPDPGTTLEIEDLLQARGATEDWHGLATSALASAAFPVGLAPRRISRTIADYPIFLPDDELADREPPPFNFPPGNKDPSFVSLDGGIIDNDPFEFAHFTIMKQLGISNDRSPDTADRAVIMIAPFPQPPDYLADGEPALDLVSVLAKLFPALKNQARFKLSALILAGDETVASRYMISPHRVPPGQPQPPEEEFAIASGLLGGFGGFASRKFRDHDYQLGRRNCQLFLRTSLRLPAVNPVFDGHSEKPDDQGTLPLIPILGSAAAEVPYPVWPRVTQADLDVLQNRIKARFQALTTTLLSQQIRSPLLWAALRLPLAVGEGDVLEYIRLTILADLVKRDQIDGWQLPIDWPHPAEVRRVLSALLAPGVNLRNISGLAKATKLSAETVAAILDRCKTQKGRPFEVWQAPWKDKNGGQLYTLASRAPGTLGMVVARLSGGSRTGLLSRLNVDPPGI
jgi:hypothetical protein